MHISGPKFRIIWSFCPAWMHKQYAGGDNSHIAAAERVGQFFLDFKAQSATLFAFRIQQLHRMPYSSSSSSAAPSLRHKKAR